MLTQQKINLLKTKGFLLLNCHRVGSAQGPMNVRAEARQRAGLLTLVLESQLLLTAPGSRVNKEDLVTGNCYLVL